MGEPERLPSEEERLLTRAEALELLRSIGRTVQRVIRVCDDDAILFLGAFGRPWTAWVERIRDGLNVRFEEGWSAQPNSCARVSAPLCASPPPAAAQGRPVWSCPEDDVPDGA